MNYYKSAIEYINLKISDPYFFVFTIGDTSWTKENFKEFENTEIVENDNPDLKGFEKMRIMSLCKHNIIANSSFGWWSAWLNENPNKIVIAPKKWIDNEEINQKISKYRLPQSWIKI